VATRLSEIAATTPAPVITAGEDTGSPAQVVFSGQTAYSFSGGEEAAGDEAADEARLMCMHGVSDAACARAAPR
jgi:hypothetical protein